MIQCYDAEEQGLIGAFYYSRNPIRTIEQHVLMLNFDMMGRPKPNSVVISGVGTGEGLEDWLRPYFDASGLYVSSSPRG